MRNVIVTGGSRGIGLAISRHLAGSGYHVLAVARRDNDSLHEARESVAKAGAGKITFIKLDLAEIETIPEFVRIARKDFGPIFGLVNNAGIGTEGLLAMMPNAEIEALIRINTLSPILMTKYVSRGMMAEGGGRIVNISSIIGSTGFKRTFSLRGHQGCARRLHPLAVTRSRAHERHCQRGRTRLHQHRNDVQPGGFEARSGRAPERPETPGAMRRRRRHGGFSDGRWWPQHHWNRDDGRRRQYGLIHRVSKDAAILAHSSPSDPDATGCPARRYQ